MDKAPDAFRTISEVADDLDVPQHVLRFWETRFTQIKPMKRSGGRRYYRPDDVNLLRGIRRLLYGEGYTIRGVQRILREHGVKSVQGLDDTAPDRAPALLDGVSFEEERHADPGFENEVETSADDDADDAADESDNDVTEAEVEPPLARGAMDFSPASSLRSQVTDRAPAIPVVPIATVPKPVVHKPATAVSPIGPSGADAYAPPSVRKVVRPGDRGKLQAALDDLVGARALIDRVLKDS